MFQLRVGMDDAGVRRMAFAILSRIGDLRPQMQRLGMFMRRAAGDRLKARQSEDSNGKLRASLAVHADRTSVKVGSNLRYAAIQQLGGTVYPRTVKRLAIPVQPHLRRRGIWPRDLKDDRNPLFPYESGDKVFLARRRGKNGAIELMYRLVAKATIKARPYILFDGSARQFLRDELAKVIARFRRG